MNSILIFGPNGSGKGTQGAVLRSKLGIPHLESGVLFRSQIEAKTKLGTQAKAFIERGELVPDSITIPMMIDRIAQPDCANGWILDGFPRSPAQAQSLDENLKKAGIAIDYVIEIQLDRLVAKQRIMGRRLCVNDNNHPNHIAIEAIKPAQKDGKLVCRVCGGQLKTRADDQDEAAINKRHDIYYDREKGTLAAVEFFKKQTNSKLICVDGAKDITEVTASILAQLQ